MTSTINASCTDQAEEELPLKPVEHDEHEGLDEQSLKEHEEVRCMVVCMCK